MREDQFIEELKKLDIKISDKQLFQLNKYYELLVEYNKVMNLTRITEKDEVYLKHFYDSVTLAYICDFSQEKTLVDVGTGAGFPGLVLKIIYPHLEVDLVDSLNKRLKFLDKVIEELKLEKIRTIHSRIEDYAKKEREKYDVVTARAVSNLPMLLETCVPLVKVNKYFIPMKAEIKDELINSKNAIKELDVTLEKKYELLLPIENSKRTLLKFKKNSKTKEKYPRKFSDIRRKPL